MTVHNIQYFNKLSPNAHLHENEGGGGASRFSRSIFFFSLSLRNVRVNPAFGSPFPWTLLRLV